MAIQNKALVVPTVFKAKDELSSVLNTMQDKVKSFDSALNKLAIPVAAVTAALGYSLRSAVKFEDQMANVATIVDTSKESMSKMRAEVLAISKESNKPISEITESLYNIRSASIDASKAMETLKAATILGTTALGTTAEATDVLTSSMNVFGGEPLKNANLLFKTVQRGKTTISGIAQGFGSAAPIVESMGISMEDFLAGVASMTTSGLSAAEAQVAIKNAMAALMKPSQEMIDIFSQLGVTSGKELIQLEGNLLGVFEALEKGADKGGLNLAKAIGSQTALTAFTQITGKFRDNYLEALDDMNSGTETLSKGFSEKINTASFATSNASNRLEVLSITIGEKLTPLLVKFLEASVPVIDAVTSFAASSESAIPIVLGLVGAFAALKTVTTAVSLIMSLSNPVGLVVVGVLALSAAIYSVVENWDTWGNKIASFVPLIGFVRSFAENWENIIKLFSNGEIINGIKAIGSALLDVLLKPLQTILEVASLLPGVGSYAKKGADMLQSFRADTLGLSDTYIRRKKAEEARVSLPVAPLVINPSSTERTNPISFQNEIAFQEGLVQKTITKNYEKSTIELSVKAENASVNVNKNEDNIPLTVASSFGF